MDVTTATIVAALVAAVVALSKALDFVVMRAKEKKSNGESKGTREMRDQVRDLHEMHNVRDENGVYVWYLDANAKRALSTIAENTTETRMLLKSLAESNKRIERAIEKVV